MVRVSELKPSAERLRFHSVLWFPSFFESVQLLLTCEIFQRIIVVGDDFERRVSSALMEEEGLRTVHWA